MSSNRRPSYDHPGYAKACAWLVLPLAFAVHAASHAHTIGRVTCHLALVEAVTGYQHHETQRWDVGDTAQLCTSGPATMDCYPAAWSTEGEGRYETNWWLRSCSATTQFRLKTQPDGIHVTRQNTAVGSTTCETTHNGTGARGEWEILRNSTVPSSPEIVLPASRQGMGSFLSQVGDITLRAGYHTASCSYAFGSTPPGQQFVSAIKRGTGAFDVFGLDPWDKKIIRRKAFAGFWAPGSLGSAWGPTSTAPTAFVDAAPAAVAPASGGVHVFATGTDGAIYQNALVGTCTVTCPPGAWQSLGRYTYIKDMVPTQGSFGGSVTAVGTNTNQYQLFAIGRSDGKAYQKRYVSGNYLPSTSGDWQSIGGLPTVLSNHRLRLSPAAVSWGPDRFDILATATDGNVYWKYFQNAWNASGAGSQLGAWESLGKPPATVAAPVSIIGSPAVTSWEPGRLDAFVTGSDGNVYHKYYAAGAWGPYGQTNAWETIGGPGGAANPLKGAPSVVSWGPNRFDVFVTGNNGTVYHRYFHNGWDGGWESWGGSGQLAPRMIAATPAVVSWGPVRLDVFGASANGTAFHKFHDHGWYAWGAGSLLGNWEAVSP